jgi:uncharacterized protein YjbJ (UPF0337 family)
VDSGVGSGNARRFLGRTSFPAKALVHFGTCHELVDAAPLRRWPVQLTSCSATEVYKNGEPVSRQDSRSGTMHKDRKEGLEHEVKGAVKEVAGKVTGNKLREAEGKLEKNAGKVQHAAGKAADKARDAVRRAAR